MEKVASKLADYDVVVLIDKSGSMSENDCPGGKTRWEYVQEFALSITKKAEQFDTNGIDVVMFSGTPKLYEGVTSDKVKQIFTENDPNGSTGTAEALQLVFDKYNTRKAAGATKPILILVFTDGEPNDKNLLVKTIIDHSNSLSDDSETGIQFVQIGKNAQAREFLVSLDNDLQGKGAKFDIVDTKNETEMDNMSITEVLEAAIAD